MRTRLLSRLQALAGTALLAGAGLFAAGPAFATYGPDIATAIAPTPAAVTLAGGGLTTYASYQVTLTHSNKYNAVQALTFTASTSVLDANGAAVAGQSAAFQTSSLPTGCTAPTPTSVSCTFAEGLAAANAVKAFTLTVLVPSAGARIALVSQTAWKDCGHPESTVNSVVSTVLKAPDPLAVNSYVPAGGATLYTGLDSGEATTANPWATTVTLPSTAAATTVSVQETIQAVTCAADLTTCNLSVLTIPGTFVDKLQITLRRDVSTISKHANIASSHVYYDNPAHPAAGVVYPLDVPMCSDTTYGALPRSGVPCIAARIAYPKANDDCDPRDKKKTPPSSVPAIRAGDWEFQILAIDNGRFIN